MTCRSAHAVERPRTLRRDPGRGRARPRLDLTAALRSDEAVELLLDRPSPPRRLLLEGAERSKLTLGVDQLLHGCGAERADQLVLQVGDADVEAEPFHIGASELAAEADSLKSALEVPLLRDVTEAGQPDVEPLWAEPVDEASNRARLPSARSQCLPRPGLDRAALGQRFEGAPVTVPLDEDNGMGGGGVCSHHAPIVAVPGIAAAPSPGRSDQLGPAARDRAGRSQRHE